VTKIISNGSKSEHIYTTLFLVLNEKIKDQRVICNSHEKEIYRYVFKILSILDRKNFNLFNKKLSYCLIILRRTVCICLNNSYKLINT